MDIEDVFLQGMKERLPEIQAPLRDMPMLNLGAGKQEVAWRGVAAYNLDRPHWDASQPLPFGDEQIGGIFAYHFLEHLADPRPVLRECARVLAPGAPLTICVPHPYGTMAYHDLDHKSFFVIDTWRNMMDSTYQEVGRSGWPFRIGFNCIMGVKERNLALITQLVKMRSERDA